MPIYKSKKDSENFQDEPQVRVDQKTYNILYSDAKYFHIRGISTIINKVVRYYSENYLLEQETRYKTIKTILLESGVNESNVDIATSNILTVNFKLDKNSGTKIKPIKIRVNKNHKEYFIMLQEVLPLYNNSVGYSEILRLLIHKYSKLSKLEREIILFKEVYDKTQKYIKRKVDVRIVTSGKPDIVLNPYEIIQPLDDEGNFVFGEDSNGKATLIALYRISIIIPLKPSSSMSESSLELLSKLKDDKFNYRILSSLTSDNVIESILFLKELTNSE